MFFSRVCPPPQLDELTAAARGPCQAHRLCGGTGPTPLVPSNLIPHWKKRELPGIFFLIFNLCSPRGVSSSLTGCTGFHYSMLVTDWFCHSLSSIDAKPAHNQVDPRPVVLMRAETTSGPVLGVWILREGHINFPWLTMTFPQHRLSSLPRGFSQKKKKSGFSANSPMRYVCLLIEGHEFFSCYVFKIRFLCQEAFSFLWLCS